MTQKFPYSKQRNSVSLKHSSDNISITANRTEDPGSFSTIREAVIGGSRVGDSSFRTESLEYGNDTGVSVRAGSIRFFRAVPASVPPKLDTVRRGRCSERRFGQLCDWAF